MNKNLKIHLFFILLLVLSIAFVYNDNFSNRITKKHELAGMHYFLYFFNRETIVKYHQFPLWIPNMYGGEPFFALPQSETLVFHALPLILLIPNVELTLNIVVLLEVFLAGLAMYLLMLELKLKPKYAFISAIVYVFNGFMLLTSMSWIERYKVFIYLPITFIFMRRAFSREWFKNSLLAGLFLALQFHGGGVDFFLFSILVPATYFIIQIFGANFKKRLLKAFLIGIVMSIVFFGLIAVNLLPMLEFSKFSSKESSFSFEDSVGWHLQSIKDVLRLPINLSDNPGYPTRIGIVAILLCLGSLLQWRKREVLFSYLLIIVTVLVASGSFLYYFLWKYVPGFGLAHHVHRSLFLFNFAAAILAGIGASALFEKLEKVNTGLIRKNVKVIFVIVLILLLLNTVWIGKPIYEGEISPFFAENKYLFESIISQVQNNHLLQNVSKEPGIFRVENIGTATHSGQSTIHIITLGMQQVYGGTSVWIPEYFNVYLALAHSKPAKFYGILNVKYLYNEAPVNATGLKFVKKFEECENCWETQSTDHGVDGPYLYLNEEYLPRAYFVDNSILVIGGEDTAKNSMYALMLEDSFNPANTVIIVKSGKVQDYSQDFLNKFSAIVLTQGSVDQGSFSKLQNYVDSGKILLPDIIKGDGTITLEDINKMLSNFKGDYSKVKEVNISYYSPNKIVLNPDKIGFMVLSEKFFMFEGWHCSINGKDFEIQRADGIISAMYLDDSGKMECVYKPKSFRNGLIITIITLALIIFYFVYIKVKK